MPDLTRLHELAGQVRPPDVADLARVATARQRRTASAVTGGVVAALVLVASVVSGGVGRQETSPGPLSPGGPATRAAVGPTASPSPTSSPSPTAYAALTADEIRHHPNATVSTDPLPAGGAATQAPGVRARVWTVCLGGCVRGEYVPGQLQRALEVTHDDFATAALYVVTDAENLAHVVDDWYLAGAGAGSALMDSRGHQRPVKDGAAGPLVELAGPLVFTNRGLAWVDVGRSTVHRIADDPDAGWGFEEAEDSWYWGVASRLHDTTVVQVAVAWRRADGTFGARMLPIGSRAGGPGMLTAERPGTMAVVDHYASPRVAHVSTDFGATWQKRLVPVDVESGGSLPADWTTWARG